MRPLALINAQAMWGLSAALQQETAAEPFTVSEVRVQLQVMRPLAERKAEPRGTPLSHELGAIVAGIAGTAKGEAADCHVIERAEDVARLRARFSVMDEPYEVNGQ